MEWTDSKASSALKSARVKLRGLVLLANNPNIAPERRRAARALARSALALVKLRARDAAWRAGKDAIDATEEPTAAAIDAYLAAEEARWRATWRGRLSTLWSMLPEWVHWLLIVLAFVAVMRGCAAIQGPGALGCPEDMSDADCRDFLGVDLNEW